MYEKLEELTEHHLAKKQRFHVVDVWSEVDRRWRQNVVRMNKHLAPEARAKCATDFLTTFWGLLWSIRWRPLKSSQLPNNPLDDWRTLYTKPTLFFSVKGHQTWPGTALVGLRSILLVHFDLFFPASRDLSRRDKQFVSSWETSASREDLFMLK